MIDYRNKRYYELEDLDGEEWCNIPSWNNIYYISNYGRVKSFKRYKDGTILKPYVNGKGYLRVKLQDKLLKRREQPFVHKLVSKAFIANPENKPQANHIDKNIINNHFSNLECCTNQENTNHRFTGDIYTPILTDDDKKDIYEIYLKGKVTQRELADFYEVGIATINRIVNKNKPCNQKEGVV